MNYRKRGPFVAPFTQLLLDHGADPNVRASLRKQLHPGYGDTTRHEYRDVTPLSWGRRFHAPGLRERAGDAADRGGRRRRVRNGGGCVTNSPQSGRLQA